VGEVMTVHLNTTKTPLNDRRVRKAILYALDREAFIQASGRRVTEGVYSPVPARLMPGGIREQEVKKLGLDYALDISKAKRLLAEAGVPDGFSLKAVGSEKRSYRFVYRILTGQLEKIGVQCRVEIVPHAVMHRRIRADEADIVVYGAFRPNADAYLTRFFHSDSAVVSGRTPDTNFSHYAGADTLIEAARAEIDPDHQIRLWVHAQIKILSDAAAYPLFSLIQCQLRGRHVDYGHPLKSTMALYPQFTETTRILE
jgi:peptide/nickel transport system substrate-binding protein